MNDSYYDNDNDYDVDWMSICAEMSNTIDSLNTNVILLNKFIESAIDLYDCSMNFKENIEITSFDVSGNIMTCVKSDGYGNYIPCVFMDLSSNMIPLGLPSDENSNNNTKTNRERNFSPLSPYYYPYYSPYYNPYYNPNYNPYSILLNNVRSDRDFHVKNMMNVNESCHDPLFHHPKHNSTNNQPMHYRPLYYRPPYYRPPYYHPPHYPPHNRPPYYPFHHRPPYYPFHHRPPYNDSINVDYNKNR